MFTIPINLQRADRVNNISAGQKGRKTRSCTAELSVSPAFPGGAGRGSLGSVRSLCEQDQPQSSPRAQLPCPSQHPERVPATEGPPGPSAGTASAKELHRTTRAAAPSLLFSPQAQQEWVFCTPQYSGCSYPD